MSNGESKDMSAKVHIINFLSVSTTRETTRSTTGVEEGTRATSTGIQLLHGGVGNILKLLPLLLLPFRGLL